MFLHTIGVSESRDSLEVLLPAVSHNKERAAENLDQRPARILSRKRQRVTTEIDTAARLQQPHQRLFQEGIQEWHLMTK